MGSQIVPPAGGELLKREIGWKIIKRKLAFSQSYIVFISTTAWISQETNIVDEKGREQGCKERSQK